MRYCRHFTDAKFIGAAESARSGSDVTISTGISTDGVSWSFNQSTISSASTAGFFTVGADAGHLLLLSGSSPAEVWLSENEGLSWSMINGPWETGDNTGAFFAIKGNMVAVATNTEIYSAPLGSTFDTFDLAAGNCANGHIRGVGNYNSGTTATLVATADPGYLFTGWTGDASGATNPLEILVNANKTVGAAFSPDLSDSDGDGLSNYSEVVTYGTNPELADTDSDGLNDAVETNTGNYISPTNTGTNPTNPDTDGDGLLDGTEIQVQGTNPIVADTDADGVNDSSDVFPLDPAETIDTDHDGTGDNADADDDGDGLSDIDEINIYGTNPELADTDDDRLNDGAEQNAGSNPLQPDTDGDGVPDGLEVREHTSPIDPEQFNDFSRGLVVYYPFDDTTLDWSGHSNHGVLQSGGAFSTDRLGNPNAALSVDQSQILRSVRNTGISGNSPVSVSFWFYTESEPVWANGYLLGIGGRNQGGMFVPVYCPWMENYGSDKNFRIDAFYAGVETKSVPRKQSGKWTHLVATYNSNLDSVRFYVDGKQYTGPPIENVGLDFACNWLDSPLWVNGIDGSPNGIDGRFDEVRFYNRALSAKEAMGIYRAEAPSFLIIKGAYTWQEAKVDADARGCRLAVLDTQVKIDEVTALLGSTSAWPNLWIGLTDELAEGDWRWVDDSLATATKWAMGEPDSNGGKNEDGTAIFASEHGLWPGYWFDAEQDLSFGYVLETMSSNFNLLLASTGSGSITGSGSYAPGETATLTAIPNPGYLFTGWTDDASGTDNPLSVLMDSDKTVGATFSPDLSDSDGDGLSNYSEVVTYGTNPELADTDSDGLNDGVETNTGIYDSPTNTGTNPNNPDTDGDGLADETEMRIYGTNPNMADTDSDDVPDGLEVKEKTSPIDATKFNSFSKGMIAYWPFNGNSNDETGNGNSGQATDLTAISDRFSNPLSAFQFNGVSSMIRGTNPIVVNGEITLSFWIKWTVSGSLSGILTRDGWENGFVHTAVGSGGVSMAIAADNPQGYEANPYQTNFWKNGDWNHVVLIRSALRSSYEFYTNGHLIGSQPLVYAHAPASLSPFTIGAWNNVFGNFDRFLDGQLDDMRLYGRALGAQEILELNNQELTNPERYKAILGSYTWPEAKADAEARGGRLAVLDTQEKIEEANSYLLAKNHSTSIWIGLTDDINEGQWKWITGVDLSASNWNTANGEPNNGSGQENCAFMDAGAQLRWNDAASHNQFGYLFELIDSRFNITVNSSPHGSVFGSGKYQPGSMASISATADPGYVFAGWTGDASGTTNPLEILIDDNKTVGVTFTRISPTFSVIPDLTIAEDGSTGALAFTISDLITPASSLSVSGSSNNLGLVPNDNIVFGGSSGSRTVTVTPLANQSGVALITLTVSNGEAASTETFLLTVQVVPATRMLLTRLSGVDSNKVLAQVYLDDVPVGLAGASFRVIYPVNMLRIAGASSLIIPSGGLPAGVTPTWNVAPGNDYANQTGSVSMAAAWGSAHTFTNGQAVANLVFEINPAAIGQVHCPLTLTEAEVGTYNADGPSTSISVTGQIVTFSRTYTDWALATLGDANADPDADNDHDGFKNSLEFASSTNPNDANSTLKTTAAEHTPEGFTLRWHAAYGVNYRVRWSNDLSNWNDLVPSYQGSGADADVTDFSAPPAGRFYRVEVIPAQ
jgi:uncharacterized repeat protein (TIGR02543 family)